MLLHHEALERGSPQAVARCSDSRCLHASCDESELLFGVEVSPRRPQDTVALEAFLPYVAVLDFPDDAAAHYAHIRADLKMKGQMIGANDLFIAAHARSRGLTLVTNNIAEFSRVKGLALANWTLPVRRVRTREDK